MLGQLNLQYKDYMGLRKYMHKTQDRLHGLMFDWREHGTHKSPLFISILLSLGFFIIVLIGVDIEHPPPKPALKQGVLYYLGPVQDKILAKVRQGTLLPPYIPAYAQPSVNMENYRGSDFLSMNLTPPITVQNDLPDLFGKQSDTTAKRWFLQLPAPEWVALENPNVLHPQTSEMTVEEAPASWGTPIVCREEKNLDIGWVGFSATFSVSLGMNGVPEQIILVQSSGSDKADAAAQLWLYTLRWQASSSLRSGLLVVEWKEVAL